MSMLENPKMKFLLIIPIIMAIIFLGTRIMEPAVSDNTEKREQILAQFTINYESMMNACGEDDLNAEELQSCFDAFVEVREFYVIENADQCGDEQIEQLEQELLDI